MHMYFFAFILVPVFPYSSLSKRFHIVHVRGNTSVVKVDLLGQKKSQLKYIHPRQKNEIRRDLAKLQCSRNF